MRSVLVKSWLLPLVYLAGSVMAAGLPGLGVVEPLSDANAVEYARGTVAAPDGTALFVQAWQPAHPRAVLVVVHGLKDHSSRYEAAARGLTRSGVAVHALDLRGHGRSGGEPVMIESFNDYVSDVDAFITDVAGAHPGLPVFLYGHSMGGAVALTTVLDRHPKLAGLILSGAALKPGADVSPLLITVTHQLGRFTPWLPVLDLPDEAFTRDPAQLARDAVDPFIHHKAGPARTAAELLSTMERNQARFDQVELPLLVMHGTKDRLTNPEGSKELHERARSVDKTLKLYEGLFHDLLHEPEKDAVLADVDAWMQQRLHPVP